MEEKKCIRCKIVKPLTDFYKHKQMSDGRLNVCKSCKKEEAKKRRIIKMKDPEWRKKEKIRTREKYHRLNYKNKPVDSEYHYEAIKKYRKKYREKFLAKSACKNIKTPDGFEKHHWSYNKEHQTDVIFINPKFHARMHCFMIYDPDKMMYRNEFGKLLDTKEKHLDYILSKGAKCKL